MMSFLHPQKVDNDTFILFINKSLACLLIIQDVVLTCVIQCMTCIKHDRVVAGILPAAKRLGQGKVWFCQGKKKGTFV